MATEAEIAWVAGLFEGEGCACVYKRANRPYRHTELQLLMNDREPVEQFALIMGVGKVRRESPPSREGKTVWRWMVTTRDGVESACDLLLPHAFPRRHAALTLAREVARERPKIGRPKRVT